MAYDIPISGSYNFAEMDFGAAAGATTHKIGGPAGMKGRLKGIGVAISEATVFATTLGHVQVGTTADADAYGKLNIATGTAVNTVFNEGDDTDAIISADIPADTIVVITLTEGTGAGLAGKGFPCVHIDWY